MTLWNPTTKIERWLKSPDEPHQIIELDGFEVYRLERRSQVVRVLAGCAWITVAGKDVFVPRGEEMPLWPEREYSIISSPNFRPLVFEVEFR